MCHVQERPGRVPLHSHVPRLCKAGQGPEGAGPSNLCLVRLVGGQVRDAAHCVALDLDVRRQHLADEWRQAAQLYDQHLVFGCCVSLVRRLKGHLRVEGERTVHRKVPERGTSCSLNLNVGTVEEEEYRHQGVAINLEDV